MSRLTELVKQENYEDFYRFSKESGIEVRYRYALGIQKAIDKLAEYEDLGTPNDIINLIKEAQIMLENNKAHKQSLKEYEVELNTISQYTGKKDKNGKKIFENDIIEFANGVSYRVVFEDFMPESDFDSVEIVGRRFDNKELEYEKFKGEK